MSVSLLLILIAACLIGGAVIMFITTYGDRRTIVAVMLLLAVGAAISITPAAPAHAATSDCANPDNSLTVTQTSTMDNLAPGIAPVTIAGLVTNNGTDSTYLTAVGVEIVSVTTERGSPAGVCDPSNYVLLDTTMPVGRTLGPGGSAPFTGASIGFSNKATNQDACKHATIRLLYTANPD